MRKEGDEREEGRLTIEADVVLVRRREGNGALGVLMEDIVGRHLFQKLHTFL